MSAIAGISSADGGVDRRRLERIHQALAHRGSDHEQLHTEAGLGLAYRGWASDSSARPSPPPASLGSCRIVSDARLDNRLELTKRLDIEATSLPDSELILRAYIRWERECLELLEGDFAFALWDGTQQRLFCARDPLGIRPFFYRWDGKYLVWASEVKALLADPEYVLAPDEAMIGEYVLGWSSFPDASATFYRGIRQLPGGHCLTLQNGELEVQRYWDIEPGEEEGFRRPFEQNAEEFGNLFQRAVRQRLARAERMGAMVSGGLDSTSIGCLAERFRANREAVPTIYYSSFYTDSPGGDERAHVREFAQKYGCEVEFHRIEKFRLLEGIEDSVDLRENPLLDLGWSVIRPWAVELRARRCQAVLSGFGGDNIFPAADPSYAASLWKQRGPLAGWRAARELAAESVDSPRRVLAAALRLLLPGSVKRVGKRLLRRELPPWVRRDFARRSGLLEHVRQPPARRGFSTLSQELDYQHLASGRFGLQVCFFDRFGAARGLEFRHPFLYPPLVRLAVLVPPEQKISGWETKRLLRYAMRGVLPEGVRQRRDKGTPDPFLLDWIRRNDSQRWRELAANLEYAGEYVEPRQVRALVERLLGGDDRVLKPAWSLLALELWLRYNFGSLEG